MSKYKVKYFSGFLQQGTLRMSTLEPKISRFFVLAENCHTLEENSGGEETTKIKDFILNEFMISLVFAQGIEKNSIDLSVTRDGDTLVITIRPNQLHDNPQQASIKEGIISVLAKNGINISSSRAMTQRPMPLYTEKTRRATESESLLSSHREQKKDVETQSLFCCCFPRRPRPL